MTAAGTTGADAAIEAPAPAHTDTPGVDLEGSSAQPSTSVVFRALLLRDLTVLDRDLKEYLPTTLIQPIMLVFIFTYVMPRIGQGIGGSASRWATLLLGGLVAQAIIFQGIFRVALGVAREFDMTNELEDRVLAPTSVLTIAFEKITAGALQSLFAGLIVFPVAAFLPSTPLYLKAHWLVLLTITPLACYTSSAFGLAIGTLVEPRLVRFMAGYIALPLGFLGAIFYTWDALTPILWLKYAILVNPLVYMSEGFRAALSTGVPHMPLWAIYGALGIFAALLTALGIAGFKKRVIS